MIRDIRYDLIEKVTSVLWVTSIPADDDMSRPPTRATIEKKNAPSVPPIAITAVHRFRLFLVRGKCLLVEFSAKAVSDNEDAAE